MSVHGRDVESVAGMGEGRNRRRRILRCGAWNGVNGSQIEARDTF
jgi:hypothetical protein